MRLGNLLSKDTKKALYAVAVVPWHRRPDTERMQIVSAACQEQAKKIGQFIDKKGRRLCTEEIPYGRKIMTDWVIAHATAIAESERYLNEKDCLNRSLYDVLVTYGYTARPQQLHHEFSRFTVR